jgi:hypothetical protein
MTTPTVGYLILSRRDPDEPWAVATANEGGITADVDDAERILTECRADAADDHSWEWGYDYCIARVDVDAEASR